MRPETTEWSGRGLLLDAIGRAIPGDAERQRLLDWLERELDAREARCALDPEYREHSDR